ncbi:MAG TPA: hypothetical protein VKX17_14475 [Planctomycetota bacterium]|nr:hypothetical protein [Planctomycetota bacterium]
METTLEQDGSVTLDHIPFRKGQQVEIIILPGKRTGKKAKSNKYPLWGKPFKYDDPFEPVAVDDWEVLK